MNTVRRICCRREMSINIFFLSMMKGECERLHSGSGGPPQLSRPHTPSGLSRALTHMCAHNLAQETLREIASKITQKLKLKGGWEVVGGPLFFNMATDKRPTLKAATHELALCVAAFSAAVKYSHGACLLARCVRVCSCLCHSSLPLSSSLCF